MNEPKNSIESLNIRLNQAEDIRNKLEDRPLEIIQSMEKKKKMESKHTTKKSHLNKEKQDKRGRKEEIKDLQSNQKAMKKIVKQVLIYQQLL